PSLWILAIAWSGATGLRVTFSMVLDLVEGTIENMPESLRVDTPSPADPFPDAIAVAPGADRHGRDFGLISGFS
ncbi:MAG: hypothetical protein ACKVH7_11740, partial [Alphaproteobacteria bacterium]